MRMPTYLHFDNPEFYKQKLPAELANSRVWQLVYGEFRAPKYMAVMRDFITHFNWTETKESDVALAVQLLVVWRSIPLTRMREWPTMHAALKAFSTRLANEQERLVITYIHSTCLTWIDNDTVWHALIEEPYERLQR